MDMSGMDMGGDDTTTEVACKISMLWNWYTVDSCFLSSTWHNHTKAQFAGSVIGVFFWVMAIEGVRRLGREYDRKLVAAHRAAVVSAKCGCASGEKDASDIDNSVEAGGFVAMKCRPKIQNLPTWSQQVVRALIYGVQYSNAFLVMLLGMYYNGYILFAIFLGGFAGYTVFGSDTVALPASAPEKSESPCCC